MNLKQAQQHFLRDAKYRQQYDNHKNGVELAMHALAVRKELGISLSELASELGISKYDISKFEKLRGVEPWVISVIVTRFERELRQCGIQVDKWFVARPQPKEIPPKPGQNVDAYGRLAPNLQISRKGRATVLTIDRKRQKSHEEKAGKV